MAIEKSRDHISKLSDDLLGHILSLVPYKDVVRASSVSRRWEHLHTMHPNVSFAMSVYDLDNSARVTPSLERVRSMKRTLRRRCRQDGSSDAVKKLRLEYRRDIDMECRYADKFIALARAEALELSLTTFTCRCCKRAEHNDAGPWTLELPPATAELTLASCMFAVRQPRIHGPGVNALKSLTLMLVRSGSCLQDTSFPSLEHLHIDGCTLPGSLDITSDNMPCLKHLRVSDVSVMTNDTDAAINVLADELRTLHMSCSNHSSLEPPWPDPSSDDDDDDRWEQRDWHFRASFTEYSAFRLRAPKLEVFHWNYCYAKEVRVESVGALSDVLIELKAGRAPRRRQYIEEIRVIEMEDCEKLTKDILDGLMPGRWNYVERNFMKRDDTQIRCEITST